jgi:hypothetical protein
MPGSARSRSAPGMTGRGFRARMLKQRRCLAGPCAGRAPRRSRGGKPRSPENAARSSSRQAHVEGRRITPTEPGKPASMANPPCYASKFTAFCFCSGSFGRDRTGPLPWRRGHWASTVIIFFGFGSFGQSGVACLRQARVRLAGVKLAGLDRFGFVRRDFGGGTARVCLAEIAQTRPCRLVFVRPPRVEAT